MKAIAVVALALAIAVGFIGFSSFGAVLPSVGGIAFAYQHSAAIAQTDDYEDPVKPSTLIFPSTPTPWMTPFPVETPTPVGTPTPVRTPEYVPPTGSVVINQSYRTGVAANHTTSEWVMLVLTYEDEGSGVSEMRTGFDGVVYSEWHELHSFWPLQLLGGNGLKTVYVQFQDRDGNVSIPYTDTITLDTTAGQEYGISINNAALWSNTTAVLLTLPAEPYTTEMQVSNDGSFQEAEWESYRLYKNWEITAYGNHVIPRTVYARFRRYTSNDVFTAQDDIVLDMTPPEGSVEILDTANLVRSANRSVTLQVNATDENSGVDKMQLSNRISFDEAIWLPYSTQVEWTLDDLMTAYVRFKDHAGNVSAIKFDSLLDPSIHLPTMMAR